MSQQHGIFKSVKDIDIFKNKYKRYASVEIYKESGLVRGGIQHYTAVTFVQWKQFGDLLKV
jgi:hypothetical protein